MDDGDDDGNGIGFSQEETEKQLKEKLLRRKYIVWIEISKNIILSKEIKRAKENVVKSDGDLMKNKMLLM